MPTGLPQFSANQTSLRLRLSPRYPFQSNLKLDSSKGSFEIYGPTAAAALFLGTFLTGLSFTHCNRVTLLIAGKDKSKITSVM